jgi:hypothetical protein
MISLILAFLWAWSAIAYHLLQFVRINPLAYAFSGVSALGALVFLWHGVFRNRLRFGWPNGVRGAAGTALVIYALVGYPAWSLLLGHRYPAIPTFGAPCPTTILTIGMLAFMREPYPRSVLIVPVLWCAVGVQAAFFLAMPQDLALALAGVIGLGLLVRSEPRVAAGV